MHAPRHSAGFTRASLFEIVEDGFVPGEEVAFAPVLIHSSAGLQGGVRSLIELDDPDAELLVFGRVSGTLRLIGPRL